jgi:hypothetical protein
MAFLRDEVLLSGEAVPALGLSLHVADVALAELRGACNAGGGAVAVPWPALRVRHLGNKRKCLGCGQGVQCAVFWCGACTCGTSAFLAALGHKLLQQLQRLVQVRKGFAVSSGACLAALHSTYAAAFARTSWGSRAVARPAPCRHVGAPGALWRGAGGDGAAGAGGARARRRVRRAGGGGRHGAGICGPGRGRAVRRPVCAGYAPWPWALGRVRVTLPLPHLGTSQFWRCEYGGAALCIR